jgi:hypothetical protein
MPKPDQAMIDMKPLGHLLEANTPDFPKNAKPGFWELTFDTGIIMYIPETMFLNMEFSLEQKD